MDNQINNKKCCLSESRAGKVLKIIGMVFIGVIVAVLFALVFGFVVKWLWNFLMPDLFGLARITYLQAFAMIVLAKLLFGAFGSHRPGHPHRPPRRFEKWHDRFSCHPPEPWDIKDDRNSFSRFWQEEGKEAFETYIKRIEGAEKDGGKE
jgi:hypothetical protein